MMVEGARKDMELEFLKGLKDLEEDQWETLENVVSHFTGKHGIEMDFIAHRVLKLALTNGVMTADDLYEDMGQNTMAHHNIIGTTFRYLQAKGFISKVGLHNMKKRTNSHGAVVYQWSITDRGREALLHPYVVEEAPASMSESD
jgi:transcription initiation factor IIE alpha subunit